MPNFFRAVTAAAVLTIGLGSASVLYAATDQANPQGSQAPSGMMDNGTMGGTGMMGHNGGAGMMGSGGMMGRMSRMMDSCSQMMQGGTQTPNSQWSKPSRD